MLSEETNRLITRVGPGTAGGEVLRRHWQPAALTAELGGGRPLVPVDLLGEQLVLFRDEAARLGLIGRWCPHRGVDLAFGRMEDGGLRCPFHGWLLDGAGACLETPAEPEGSRFHTRIRHPAYPVVERNGIVWAWLGGGEPPPLPPLDCLVAPPEQVFAFKGRWACNWLQAHEVGIDPAHASFLHRFLADDDPRAGYGRQFRSEVDSSGLSMTALMRSAFRPHVTAVPTSFGFRLRTLRRLDPGLAGPDPHVHVRVTNCIFPNAIAIPLSDEMTITQWHVPHDEESCSWYSMFVSYGAPVDAAALHAQRIGQVELPTYASRVGRAEGWGFDPEEQARTTYTGMGHDINVHDQWAVESPGPLTDRTREHLSPTDVGIRTHRRMLIRAVEEVVAEGSGTRLRPAGPVRAVGAVGASAAVPAARSTSAGAGPAAATVVGWGPATIDALVRVDAAEVEGAGPPLPPERAEAAWRERESARRVASGWAPPLSD